MSRRFNSRYFVRLSRDHDFKLSASEFHELRNGGWIEPDAPGSKYARLRKGVVAWVRGGDLWLAPICHMPCVTAKWFFLWLFRVSLVSASQIGESWSDLQERILIDREREAQNEALLWRTFRNTKGANEFRWIPAKHKAEILRALRPKMSGEAIC